LSAILERVHEAVRGSLVSLVHDADSHDGSSNLGRSIHLHRSMLIAEDSLHKVRLLLPLRPVVQLLLDRDVRDGGDGEGPLP